MVERAVESAKQEYQGRDLALISAAHEQPAGVRFVQNHFLSTDCSPTDLVPLVLRQNTPQIHLLLTSAHMRGMAFFDQS